MATGSLVDMMLAEDGIWVLTLDAPSSNDIHVLLDTPTAFLNQRLQAGVRSVVFTPTLPIDLMFSYDLSPGSPWVIQGVYDTNTVNVRIPRDVLPQSGPARLPAASAAGSDTGLIVREQPIDIRLIRSLSLGFAHFDPRDTETPAEKNFARVVTQPSTLLEFLEGRRADFAPTYFAVDDRSVTTAGGTQVDFIFSPTVTARLQRVPEASETALDDEEPPPVSGNCVKKTGDLHFSPDDDRVVFEITHFASLRYTDPPPPHAPPPVPAPDTTDPPDAPAPQPPAPAPE